MGDSWVIPTTYKARNIVGIIHHFLLPIISNLPCSSRKHSLFSLKLNQVETQTILSTFLGITQEVGDSWAIPSVISLTERSVPT